MSSTKYFEATFNGKKIGVFSGENSKIAGSKAFTVLNRTNKNDIIDDIQIKIIDQISRETHSYNCKRIKLDTPKTANVEDEKITYSYMNTIKRTNIKKLKSTDSQCVDTPINGSEIPLNSTLNTNDKDDIEI